MCESQRDRKTPRIAAPLLIGLIFMSIAGYPLPAGTLPSVSLSNSTFAFETLPANTWLAPQTTVIVNDGLVPESLAVRISALTADSNTWTLSATTNGADSIRVQWSIASDTGSWTDITAYDTDFRIDSSLAANDSISFWLRIQTPTATTSYEPHTATVTVTASLL